MFGLFGRFGRAQELRHIDEELRGAGVHPALVPDAAKLTIARLLKAAHGAVAPHGAEAAPLVAYCMLGPETFGDANGPASVAAVERRVAAAVAAGDSLDARLILLTLHAGLIRPEVVARFGLEIDA